MCLKNMGNKSELLRLLFKSPPQRPVEHTAASANGREVLPPILEPISIPEIAGIMPQMQAVVAELKRAFRNGDYGLLVGDDTSGRIPTLILKGVIDHINKSYGRSSIPTVFVQSSQFGLSRDNTELLTVAAKALVDLSKRKRALIVTEYLDTGNHVKHIGELIHQYGGSYDIVTLGQVMSTKAYRNNMVIRSSENIYPSTAASYGCPPIYGESRLTGLTRQRSRVSVDRLISRKEVSEARDDVRRAINQLISNL